MNSNIIHFSIGLITDEEEIPLKRVQASPDDRMESIIFENLGQFHVDFVVLCGDTQIWSAKEYGGAAFDFSPYDGYELMIYRSDSEKYKVLKELRKAYKNATDTLAQFFVKTPMPHIHLQIESTPVVALVDTGAQLSIITKSLAEKCGIIGKLDTRFQVDAHGIGGLRQALGKILDVELEFSGYYLPVVLTVFEECSLGSDLVIGVDILIAYNACVDFKRKCVRFNDEVEKTNMSTVMRPGPNYMPAAFSAERSLKFTLTGDQKQQEEAMVKVLGGLIHPENSGIACVRFDTPCSGKSGQVPIACVAGPKTSLSSWDAEKGDPVPKSQTERQMEDCAFPSNKTIPKSLPHSSF